MKSRASDLARKGRFGDDALLHVSKQELAGLASLAPNGKLSTNPDTGLPEAFFFLPFLAGLGSLFGAAAPAAAIGAPAAAAAGAGALGAGMAAGMTAATTAIPTAATAASALPAAAEMAAAATAPATAAASTLPTALSGASGLSSLAGGAGVDALSSLPAATTAGLEAAASPMTAGVSSLNAPSLVPQSIPGAATGAGATEFGPGFLGTTPTAATSAPQVGDLAAGIGPSPITPSPAGQSYFPPTNVPAANAATPVPSANPSGIETLTGGEGSDVLTGATAGADTIGTGAAVVGDSATNALGESVFEGLGNLDPTTMLMLASMMPSGGGGGDDDDEDSDVDVDAPYEGPTQRTAPKNYRPGIDPEFRYFSEGGIARLKNLTSSGGMGQDQFGGGETQQATNTTTTGTTLTPGNWLLNYGLSANQDGLNRFKAGVRGNNFGHDISGFGPTIASNAPLPGQGQPIAPPVTPTTTTQTPYVPETQLVMPPSGYQHGVQAQWDFYKPAPAKPVAKAGGGLVKRYANGGLASLGPVQPLSPAGGTPPNPSIPSTGGLGSLADAGPEPIPESPFPKTQVGSKAATQRGDQDLIAQTVAAIQGAIPPEQGQQIILAFINTFGEDALDDLVQRIRSSGEAPAAPQGVSDGMSDSIPATINGQEPAMISEGEFIIPADVVSGLGNGSTDAGANQLHGMMDRVRKMRGGGMVQPPMIDARKAMPV